MDGTTDKGRVLVTGATGLVGTALIRALVHRGYHVHALSRNKRESGQPEVRFFQWDVPEGRLEEDCLEGVRAIIHLAGENIAALPWSNRRKKQLRDSRIQSILILYDALKRRGRQDVESVISASASGYYGDKGEEWLTEDKPAANDFLGQTCRDWEAAVQRGAGLGLRTVSLRSGVVLSPQGGIFPKVAGFVKKRLAMVPGTGRQWMPWIHLDDVVSMYLFALEHNGIHGVYNMTAPQPVRFASFVRTVADTVKHAVWLPHAPRFVLKAVMGEMSELLLSSTRMSAEKIQNAGFPFRYPTWEGAAKALSSSL